MRIRLLGLWPKPPLPHPHQPHPLPLGAEGQQRLKDQFYLKRGRLFSLLFPLDFLSLPLFLLISVSGTESMSASRSEFITSLRRPWPKWIRPLKSSHQHLREAEGAGWETNSATRHRKHTDGGVWRSPEWRRTLKHVCTHICDTAKGQGRGQTRAGPD